MSRGPCPRTKTAAQASQSRSGASAFSTVRPYPDYRPAAMGDRVEIPARRVWTVDRHLTVISITESNHPSYRSPSRNEKAAVGGNHDGRDLASSGEDGLALAHAALSANDRPQADVFHSQDEVRQ